MNDAETGELIRRLKPVVDDHTREYLERRTDAAGWFSDDSDGSGECVLEFNP